MKKKKEKMNKNKKNYKEEKNRRKKKNYKEKMNKNKEKMKKKNYKEEKKKGDLAQRSWAGAEEVSCSACMLCAGLLFFSSGLNRIL